MSTEPPTIIDLCATCGHEHPVTWQHCDRCGVAGPRRHPTRQCIIQSNPQGVTRVLRHLAKGGTNTSAITDEQITEAIDMAARRGSRSMSVIADCLHAIAMEV